MRKQYDVIALGELLIDFTENGYSIQGNPMMEVNPGGAPCNLLSMLGRLGKKTSFLGMVGKDQFGALLKSAAKEMKIDTGHLYEHESVHTTLAFVHTMADGDRQFAFYRNPGADMMLEEKHVDPAYIKSAKALHYGTLSMTHEGIWKATVKAIDIAKEAGMILSFDPNLRPPLWDNLEDAKLKMRYGFSKCDLLKISEEELEFATGRTNIEEGADKLLEEFPNIKLMNVTMGKHGSLACYQGRKVFGHPFVMEHTIETTGAGDCFGGCILNDILNRGFENLTDEELLNMLEFANAAAALVTTRKGALKVMPTKAEVEELLKRK